MRFGEILKALRLAAGLSQSGLAKRTGIHREYLSKMETGDLPNPTLRTLQSLALGLGIDPAIFLTDNLAMVAAVMSVALKAKHEAEATKQFHALCGLVQTVSQQLEEIKEKKI